MGLYKRNGVYYMRYFADGKLIRTSTHRSSKKEANEVYFKALSRVGRAPGQHTLSELLDRYMEEHSKPNKTVKSYVRDKSLKTHLLDVIGESKIIDQIIAKDIEAYKSRRQKEGAKPKTINNELILLGHAFTKAVNWGWTDRNPMTRGLKLKVRNIVERWLTFGEENKLTLAAPLWLREIITFAVETGMREGEILGLKWENIDFERLTLSMLTPKTKRMETIPLSETAKNVLRRRYGLIQRSRSLKMMVISTSSQMPTAIATTHEM